MAVSAFSTLLPNMDEKVAAGSRKARLGRTAEGLQKLQDDAKESGFKQGYEDGLLHGRDEGSQAVRDELADSVLAFRSALDEAASRVEDGIAEWYAASEQSLSELSVAIAARILGQELALKGDAITALVREAIREITTADKVRIRVNPFDSSVLAQEKSLILGANPTVRSIEIVDDPSIAGGARIESDSGVIDATIQTQLELALKAIRGRD